MKNKLFITICISMFLTLCAHAQHEGCNHGAAPESGSGNASSALVQVDEHALKAINLKVSPVISKRIENTIPAIGKIENMPDRVSAISARISGRVVEIYVKADEKIKAGAKICKIESLLAGNPPPSVILKSQDAGVVESLNILKGSPISPNEELARIADTSKLYAVANVFENKFGLLKIGQIARIKLEAFGNEVFEAKLAKFGTKLDTTNNTIPVYFEIDNPNDKIKNGMRGIFSIIVSDNKPSISVPMSALGGDFANRFVYVEKCPNDRIYQKRHVVVGKSNDQDAEIISGLKEGEKIAVSGVYQLQFMPPAKEEENRTPSEIHTECKFEKPAADISSAEHKEHAEHKECPEHAEHNHHAEHKEDAQCQSHNHAEHADHEHAEHDHDGAGETHLEQILESGYITYFVYSALGVSLFLNVIFIIAGIAARKRGKDK